MTRILIGVGCNSYDSLPSLRGSEADAEAISDILVGNHRYKYSEEHSKTLLSPSLAELRQEIIAIYQNEPTEVLIYFSGHAESRQGRLYLKLRDTNDRLLPPTSISVSELIDLLGAVETLDQVNIVIDACNAGGIGADLARTLGERAQQTPAATGLSILAASGPEQAAMEAARGGRLTRAIVDILDGTTVSQRWSPFLDLSQIYEGVKRVPTVASQSPSFWAINLRGPSAVAPNPAFDPATAAVASPETYFSANVPLSDAQLRVIENFVHHVRIDGYEPEILRPVQEAIRTLPEHQQVSVLLGLSETVQHYERNKLNLPPDKESLLVQGLLPLADSPSVKSLLEFQGKQLLAVVLERLAALHLALLDNEKSLLARPAAFGELVLLPVRIARTLGWIGLAALHCTALEKRDALRQLSEIILRVYGNSVVSIDERQSAGLLLFLLAARTYHWEDIFDEVAGRAFFDLWSTGGRILRTDCEAKEQVAYLLARYDKFSGLQSIIQQPSELVAVLLTMGAIAGFGEIWDADLREFDGQHINMFVATEPTEFGDDRISHGSNLSMRVGHEFYKLADLRRFTQDFPLSQEMIDFSCTVVADAISLIMTDRVNWMRYFTMRNNGTLPIYSDHLTLAVDDPTAPIVLYSA